MFDDVTFRFSPKEDKDDATKVVKEPPKQLVIACQQIVDCLMETVLKSEERSQVSHPLKSVIFSNQSRERSNRCKRG